MIFGEEPRPSRFVFATAVRLGIQSALNPQGIVVTDRFFTGGGTTIRGFPQDGVGPQTEDGKPVGGNALMVLNNELRFPLVWLFDGVAFSDIGNVWAKISQFSLTDVRKSAGFGESFGGFFFSIGQTF